MAASAAAILSASFVSIAILAVSLFSVILGWLPTGGYVPLSAGILPWLRALVLPASVLALFQVGFLARMTRSAMIELLDQEFVRTARAKGVSEWRAVTHHALRNALVPVVTVVGIIVSMLVGGTVVIEQVFSLPGVGRLMLQAIMSRDYPMVQGTLLILGFTFVGDGLRDALDPRMRGT